MRGLLTSPCRGLTASLPYPFSSLFVRNVVISPKLASKHLDPRLIMADKKAAVRPPRLPASLPPPQPYPCSVSPAAARPPRALSQREK